MAEFNEETITIEDGENEYDLNLEHSWDESTQQEPKYSIEISYTGGASAEDISLQLISSNAFVYDGSSWNRTNSINVYDGSSWNDVSQITEM